MKTYLMFVSLLPLVASLHSDNRNLNGYWTLVCLTEIKTQIFDCRSDDTPAIVLEFRGKGSGGTVQCFTMRNAVAGHYELPSPGKIVIMKFGNAKAAEPHKWGNDIWNSVRQSSSFKIVSDTLSLYFDHNTKIMKFVRTFGKDR